MKLVFNLPNTLTILRFILSPLFFYYLMVDRIELALIVFMFVAVTDLADGWIARSTKQETKFGAALDPMADKFMIFLALLALIIKFDFPLWAVPIVIVRDIVSLSGSVIVFFKHKGIWKPNIFGKLTTFFQISTVLSYIVGLAFKEIILIITIIFSIIAGITYAREGIRVIFK